MDEVAAYAIGLRYSIRSPTQLDSLLVYASLCNRTALPSYALSLAAFNTVVTPRFHPTQPVYGICLRYHPTQ